MTQQMGRVCYASQAVGLMLNDELDRFTIAVIRVKHDSMLPTME